MAVKLVILKSGENVIADVKQLVDHNDKVVSLVFTNPYVVTLLSPEISFGNETKEQREHKISFHPWLILSNDKVIEVNPDWTVCVVEPNEGIKASYEKKMNLTTEGSLNLDISTSLENQKDYANVEVLHEDANG